MILRVTSKENTTLLLSIKYLIYLTKKYCNLVSGDVIIKQCVVSEDHGFHFCANNNFTLTTEIHARSLANFHCQYADRHKFKIHATRQRARAGNSTICYRLLLMSAFNASVLLLTMNFVITFSK